MKLGAPVKINLLMRVWPFIWLVFRTFALLPANETKTYTTLWFEYPPPFIDGRPDDDIWQMVPWESNFTQKIPYEGHSPSQNTAFKIIYDGENLYVAIRAYDTEPGKIFRSMSRRDHGQGDLVEIIFDSYYDHRTGFSFAVNSAGVKNDTLISNDGGNWVKSWDPTWFVKTAVDDNGWTAEMKIPFSQLRFTDKKNNTWGLQVSRFLYRKQETSEWKLIPRDVPGSVSLFGKLKGLGRVKTGPRLELTPYMVGKLHHFPKNLQDNADILPTVSRDSVDFGLDGKVRLSDHLILDLTVNPDFGQVEADPSEINLTAFETYFEEKRPFFIEGNNIMNFLITGGDTLVARDNLFYSRRIGGKFSLSPNTNHITIPAAFKLTGKTRGGFSLGILDSVTALERAEVNSMGMWEMHRETLAPLTNYFVMRLQKDYNEGNTLLGGMITAVNRDIKDPEVKIFHRAAYSGGLDFYHGWKGKEWAVFGNLVFSNVRGDKESILATQEAPPRYYQRPDARHVTLDPNRTSLSGTGGILGIDKSGGKHWRFSTGITWRSPGLELNDIGYLYNADLVMEWLWNGYRITRPFSIFRQFEINVDQSRWWNFSGETIYDSISLGVESQFKNYWGLWGRLKRHGEILSPSALHGGPSLKLPGTWEYSLRVHSDERKKFYFQLEAGNSRGKANTSNKTQLRGDFTYRPNSTLTLSIHPTFETLNHHLQYVKTIIPEENGEYLKRYVLALIHHEIVALTLRLNFSITPDLSIQFYGQPFISSGKYSDFKYITEPRADKYNDRFHRYSGSEILYNRVDGYYYISEKGEKNWNYRFENPDFKFLQFRSNFVIRWEFIPGSSLYLVWSQGRTDSQGSNAEFSFLDGIKDLFRLPAYNVFLLKLTYRFKI